MASMVYANFDVKLMRTYVYCARLIAQIISGCLI